MIGVDQFGNPAVVRCSTHKATLCLRVKKNGAQEYGNQCAICGNWENIPKSRLTSGQIATAGRYDETIWQRQRQALTAAYEAKRNAESTAWWKAYSAYLISPTWDGKRARVLSRDKGMCQGCLINKATQVHHTQYPPPEMFGKEPLFWLVSLCLECHESTHAIKDAKGAGAF